MPRRFNSFLIRWWHGDGGERLELEHIQSGRKRLVNSVSDAACWISAEADREAGEEVQGEPNISDGSSTDPIEHD